MGRILRLLCAAGAFLVLFFAAMHTTPSPAKQAVPPTSTAMSLWEAYSRGFVAISQVNVNFGGQFIALGYEVQNTGTRDVSVDEYALLMSPHHRHQLGTPTTQDGFLTKATVSAGTSTVYGYGDLVATGAIPAPPWWCTEQFQFVQAGVGITLGGELAPFDMESLLGTLTPSPGGTQEQVWAHLREHPTLVVGKTVDQAFWKEVPETAGQVLTVGLQATNIAIKDTTDQQPDPDALEARVWDVVPAGYLVDPASISPSGYTMTLLADGSTRISWGVALPAADVTGMSPGSDPTPYVSGYFGYTMTTPHIAPGRVDLPRAMISETSDFTAEGQSAQPVLDSIFVQQPPTANPGGPYDGSEGSPITFDASKSADPNDPPQALNFRWDFESDGTWDTNFSSAPTATHVYGDDFRGTARLEVMNLELTATATTNVTVHNVAPTITALNITAVGGGGGGCDDEHGDHDGDHEHEDDCGDDHEEKDHDHDDGCGEEGDHGGEHEHDDDCDDRHDEPCGGDDDHRDRDGRDDDDREGKDRDGKRESRDDDDHEHDHEDDDRDDDEGCGGGLTVFFNATATDPGSDDLTFRWDFGDGTNASRTYFNDGAGPDPFPSPGPTFPVTVTNATTHTYAAAGNYTVTLTVTDDDGGNVSITRTITVGGGGCDDEHGDHDGDHEHDDDGCKDDDGKDDDCGDHDHDGRDDDDGCGDDGAGKDPEGSHDGDAEGRGEDREGTGVAPGPRVGSKGRP